MDLLLISRKIWRYRIATLPVVALTLLGAFYVVVIKDPVYSASSSYVLINPPLPPTPEDIARNPALGHINSDNPFTRFTDQSVVVGLLASGLSTDSARRSLSEAGANPDYTVEPAPSAFGYSSLLLEITGVASTAPQAVRTAELVGHALNRELDRLQASRGVAPRYRIVTESVDPPDSAEKLVSGKLRALVSLFVLGVILLFVAISAAEALTTLRAERDGEDELKKKDEGDSTEGAATNNSPAHARSQLPNGKAEQDKSQLPNGKAEQDKSPVQERQRRPRRAGTKA